MRISFNPSTSYNRPATSKTQQNPAFGLTIPKYIEQAKKATKRGLMQDVVIKDIKEGVLYKEIAKKDGIDTLNAIREILPEGLNKMIDQSIRIINHFAA